jgi:hypothetical protein
MKDSTSKIKKSRKKWQKETKKNAWTLAFPRKKHTDMDAVRLTHAR